MFGNNEIDLKMKVSQSNFEEAEQSDKVLDVKDEMCAEMEFGKLINFLITKFVEKEYEITIT